MSAYFNLSLFISLHLGLKYTVKILLKYAHIFTSHIRYEIATPASTQICIPALSKPFTSSTLPTAFLVWRRISPHALHILAACLPHQGSSFTYQK